MLLSPPLPTTAPSECGRPPLLSRGVSSGGIRRQWESALVPTDRQCRRRRRRVTPSVDAGSHGGATGAAAAAGAAAGHPAGPAAPGQSLASTGLPVCSEECRTL